MATPNYIQVAPDSTGKKMRTEVDSVVQTDGTAVDTHREIVSAPPEWYETEREEYMRELAENTLLALLDLAAALRLTPGGGDLPTVHLGE